MLINGNGNGSKILIIKVIPVRYLLPFFIHSFYNFVMSFFISLFYGILVHFLIDQVAECFGHLLISFFEAFGNIICAYISHISCAYIVQKLL